MADPLEPNEPNIEDILPDTPADPPKVEIDAAELERLRGVAQQFEELAPTLREVQANARYQTITQPTPTPGPTADPNEAFWQDPTASTRRVAQDAITPYATAAAEKFANLSIANFKAMRHGDPFFAVVSPMFDREVGGMNKAQLGQLSDDILNTVLKKAWDACVGEYTAKRMAERPKVTPQNLGAGSGGGAAAGGPKDVKHLKDLDSEAYAYAVQAGLSEEDMAAIAAEL